MELSAQSILHRRFRRCTFLHVLSNSRLSLISRATSLSTPSFSRPIKNLPKQAESKRKMSLFSPQKKTCHIQNKILISFISNHEYNVLKFKMKLKLGQISTASLNNVRQKCHVFIIHHCCQDGNVQIKGKKLKILPKKKEK